MVPNHTVGDAAAVLVGARGQVGPPHTQQIQLRDSIAVAEGSFITNPPKRKGFVRFVNLAFVTKTTFQGYLAANLDTNIFFLGFKKRHKIEAQIDVIIGAKKKTRYRENASFFFFLRQFVTIALLIVHEGVQDQHNEQQHAPYRLQGSPSGCGWLEIPELSQVEKGVHSKQAFLCSMYTTRCVRRCVFDVNNWT